MTKKLLISRIKMTRYKIDFNEISNSIDQIADFPSTIKRIDSLNTSIVDKIAEMSHYHADKGIFNGCDRELKKKGIDVSWLEHLYWPVLSRFLNPGTNDNNTSFLQHYLELQGLLWERVWIGIKVAEYKHSQNLNITRPDREREVLDKTAAYAQSKGLDQLKTRQVFDHIININKSIQYCYVRMHPKELTRPKNYSRVVN